MRGLLTQRLWFVGLLMSVSIPKTCCTETWMSGRLGAASLCCIRFSMFRGNYHHKRLAVIPVLRP